MGGYGFGLFPLIVFIPVVGGAYGGGGGGGGGGGVLLLLGKEIEFLFLGLWRFEAKHLFPAISFAHNHKTIVQVNLIGYESHFIMK
jgi:hypothetical protein